ncbi:hypothetical protein ANCCAN_28549 [Ancylostoma caninum]|uniref:Uncharacterized protein n=1 Tax=Ancylostoma caninum TaxID=29170 RepID=A0A368F0W8_ANCCA|nr:hypothetical protein ANCCAN_28549 [Ancylostoma caninum]
MICSTKAIRTPTANSSCLVEQQSSLPSIPYSKCTTIAMTASSPDQGRLNLPSRNPTSQVGKPPRKHLILVSVTT